MSAIEALGLHSSAVIYARISKDPGHDELGVKRQVAQLSEFAAERGWDVSGVYVDNDVSASKRKHRPEYERLLAEVAAGGIDVVLVTEVTRLARRMADLVRVVDVVREADTKIHALRAGHIDLTTSGGQLQAHIMGAVAQHEVSQMIERIKAKKAEQTRKGQWVGGGRPYGYDVVNGKLNLNKREAKLIRSWVEQIIDGRTTTSLARELNETNVPTIRGGHWSTVTLNQIVQSPRIIGMTSSGGEPVAEADWEPIIDRETWERANATLKSRRRGPAARKSLLAGLVYCAECGQRMYGASRGPNRPRVYVCQTSAVPGRDGCGRVSISDKIEGYMVEQVLAVLGKSSLGDVRAERHESSMGRLVADIAEDEQALNDLAADVGNRLISRAEWLNARGPIEARLQENRAQLKALGAGDRLPADLVVDRDSWEALPFPQRQEIMKLLIDRITVTWVGPQGGVFRPKERLTVEWRA